MRPPWVRQRLLPVTAGDDRHGVPERVLPPQPRQPSESEAIDGMRK
jgi:hypothetical protein